MRTNSQRLFLAAGLTLLTLALLGCPEQTTIGQINADPGRYLNKEVGVSGTVTESFGVLNKGVYQVDDGTGRLWVFSERYGVPTQGARVQVAGRITPTVTFSGRSFTNILRETQRRR
ncbi:MAG TPA: hypothetical protein VLE48_10840 [Terriglobales bacterium]|nr:hypothetical protein [Terriglobales bacterium]